VDTSHQLFADCNCSQQISKRHELLDLCYSPGVADAAPVADSGRTSLPSGLTT
jgi:hypothetical protein